MASHEDTLLKEVVENLSKKPAKGILKNSSSFETTEPAKSQKQIKDKATKWDEMNIIATLHPPDKDYGHMKVDEPKTPFEREMPDDENDCGVDPQELANQMAKKKEEHLKIHLPSKDEDSDPDEDEEETPEQRAARKAFESKRKAHYNEFFASKMAKKLLEEEDDDDEEDSTNKPNQDIEEVDETDDGSECGTSSAMVIPSDTS